MTQTQRILIVGAGLAGLACAAELRRHGYSPVVVDKGRSVGGRLATRRIGEATLDHGAQFFTVRGDDLAETVQRAVADDLVFEWCHGFGDSPDGYPRYAVRGGMNQLAKWLSRDLSATLSTELSAISATNGVWTATATTGEKWIADAVVLTAPVPQSLRLLDNGGVSLGAELRAGLDRIEYFATLALLATVDGFPSDFAPVGGVQLDDGPFTFIAENQRKGISAAPALTFHAEHDYSLRRYDDQPADVLAQLVTFAAPWLMGVEVKEAQLKKWRYAGPKEPWPDPTLETACDGARLLFAGDAFAGPKVEGAFNSGLAAARALMASG